MKARFLVYLIFLFGGALQAQDTTLARKRIHALCANKMHGRGYYKNGAIKASRYIAREMKRTGLEKRNNTWFQPFTFPVNIFTKDPVFIFNQHRFVPGKDFIVNADAPNAKGSARQAEIVLVNAENIVDSVFRKSCTQFSFSVCIIDTLPANLEKQYQGFLRTIKTGNSVTFRKEKLTWSVGTEQVGYVAIEAIRPAGVIDNKSIQVEWEVYSKLTSTVQKNVVGFISGTEKKDSFILVTAHYDHLGRMGPGAIFPGANDNAAGVAMLLDLANYYKKNPPKYSMIFIAFAGEEAGLIGSSYYVNNPMHDLMKTRFLLNCDLVGTGETGMTVVNGAVYKTEFQLLDSLNRKGNYLPAVNRRGKAANSDHYFFSELGIPSFFWYQSGPRSSYHDVWDVPQTLTLSGYVNTFRLAVAFFEALGN